jgi:hypothetical protein
MCCWLCTSSWVRSIQSMPHPTSWRSILILSSHLRLGLPSGQLPSSLPTKFLYATLFSPTCYMPRPSHSSRFYQPNNIWWWVQILSYSLCSLLHSPVASSLLGPNILLSTLFSNTLSLCSSLSVRDQVPHPYKTSGKTTVLYSLIFVLKVKVK